MENAFIINDLMNSMLTEVEENLSANCSNAIQQQSSLQKVNEISESNDEKQNTTSELCTVRKTESSLKTKSEFLDVPSFIQNASKDSLTTHNFDVVINGDAPLNTEQQTNLQKSNEIYASNCEESSQAPELFSASKAVKNESEFSNVPTMIQSITKGSFTMENFDEVEHGVSSFFKVNDQIKNYEVESNIPKNKNQTAKNIVAIDQAKERLINMKSHSSNEMSTEMEKQRSFDKGDNGAFLSVKHKNEVMKLDNKKLIDDKLSGKEKKLIEVFSFSSLEREMTPDYESFSDNSEFFLTKSLGTESYFESEVESCSSIKTPYSKKTNDLKKDNDRKTKPKSKRFRWFRSNRVSPDLLQAEAKSKPKAKRLASSFGEGVRKFFKNVRKAYKANRKSNNFVIFCSVPFFFRCW